MSQDSSNLPTALDGVVAPTGSGAMPPADRFRKVGDAYNAYKDMRQGDQLSALNRLRYQMNLEGAPPYSPAEMKKYGLATTANANFGFMQDALTAASAPYEDLVDGAENLMRMPTRYGVDLTDRMAMQSAIEEEFTALITDDDGFDYQLAELVRQFNLHGIGVPFFLNKLGITWETTETGNFLLPRGVRASTKAIDVACCVREYMPHELWACIENKEWAESEGWDLKETREAIKLATPDVQWEEDWDKWAEQWKDNDLGVSYGKPSVIRVVHMWVVSRDGKGKVQELKFRADGRATDFMFKSKKPLGSLGEAFTIFTDGVGTNGKYHGIRGIGSKLYAIIVEMDRLWCSFIDATRQAGKIFIQPKKEGAAKNLALVEWGNFLMLPPNANFIDRTLPNYGQNIIPGLNLLSQLLQGKTGQWTTQGALDTTKEQTAREFMGKLDQIAKLSSTKVKIFYSAWERLLKEQVRRVKRKDWVSTDPDYDRVNAFYERLEARGVPREAVYQVDLRHCKVVRAMGNGSAEARTAQYERLFQMFEYYDAEGKQKLVRAATISVAGKDMGDTLAPNVAGQRPPMDKKIADLENGLMGQNILQEVEPNEIHPVHVTQHLTSKTGGLLQDIERFRAGEVGLEIIPIMRLKHTHCEVHMQYVPESMPNGTPNMERARFKEALQQSLGVIENGEKKLLAEQEKMAEEAGQQAEEGAAFSANASKALDEAQAALLKVQADAADREDQRRQREEDHQLTQQQKIQAFETEQAIKRAQADADIAMKISQKAAEQAMQPPPDAKAT